MRSSTFSSTHGGLRCLKYQNLPMFWSCWPIQCFRKPNIAMQTWRRLRLQTWRGTVIGGLHPKIFKVPCVLHIWKLHIYLVRQSWFAMLQVNLSEGKACLNIRSNFKYPAVSDMKSNGILLVNTDYWFKISCGFLYAFALQPCPQPLRKHPKKERHLVYWPKNKKDRPASYLIQDSFDIVKGWLCPLCPVKRDI